MQQTDYSKLSKFRQTQTFEEISYTEFLQRFHAVWHIGEHLAIVGTTGSGKTFVAEDIKLMRKWLVVIATKSNDDTLAGYTGFKERKTWPPDFHEKLILFWQKPKDLLDLRSIQLAIYGVMNHLYRYGGWTIYFDDLFFVSETLKLKGAIKMFYTQVRSSDVSIVSSIQRPAWVPVECLSQSTYILVFYTQDEKDIHRMAEGIGMSYQTLLRAIQQLKQYEFLLIQRGKPPIIVQKKGV